MKTLFVIALSIWFVFGTDKSNCQSFEDSDLRKVEQLGKALYEYDMACWIASDSLMAINPDQSQLGFFGAFKENGLWKVGFGQLREDYGDFQLSYEVIYNPSALRCKIVYYQIPQTNHEFYYHSAKAVSQTTKLLTPEYPPYNYAVIPVDVNQLYVYYYPAQINYENYRLGGDIRYTYSIKTEKITDSLRLHRSVQNMPYVKKDDQEIKATMSTAITTKIPVETDVFYVLSRKLKLEHYILTKDWAFILTDQGTITKFPASKFFELGRERK